MKSKRKVKFGVFITVRLPRFNRAINLSPSDLQLISDALDVLSPDSDESSDRAHTLCSMFGALSDYAKTV